MVDLKKWIYYFLKSNKIKKEDFDKTGFLTRDFII